MKPSCTELHKACPALPAGRRQTGKDMNKLCLYAGRNYSMQV
ncbi:MAG: hypothetical protein R6V23_05340 [Bacteroidales bacterium]